MALSNANRIKVGKAIHNREEFKHASMSGKWISNRSYLDWGQLQFHPETVEEMQKLLADRDLYVVFSYTTPIAYAWDREMHVPDHKYSVTTSHHQSIAKLADHYASL